MFSNYQKVIAMSEMSFKDNGTGFSREKYLITERNIFHNTPHQLANLYKIETQTFQDTKNTATKSKS